MASSRNLLASGLLIILACEAEAQIFSSATTTSGLSNTASDVLSGRFLNTLNTTQVALIISIGGLAILAIAGILFLISFFRPASASSGSSAYGSDYSSSTQSSSYSYPGYRRLRYSWRGGWRGRYYFLFYRDSGIRFFTSLAVELNVDAFEA
jgi:hypothetical protein